MSADTIKYSIKEILKTQSPELIIIDTRPFQYRDTIDRPPNEISIRAVSDSMPYSINRTEMLLNIVPEVLKEQSRNYIFDISKYHDRWKSLNKASFDYLFNEKENKFKGFFFIPSYEYVDIPSDKKNIKETIAPSSETQNVLTDLLRFCTDEKLHVFFVVAPYKETAEHRMSYNFLGEKIESYNFDFINFNDYYSQMGLEFGEDLYNIDHLNIFGAEKYTRYLGEYISENYAIPDRRTDSEYDDWKNLLPEWDTTVDSVKQTIEQLRGQQ